MVCAAGPVKPNTIKAAQQKAEQGKVVLIRKPFEMIGYRSQADHRAIPESVSGRKVV